MPLLAFISRSTASYIPLHADTHIYDTNDDNYTCTMQYNDPRASARLPHL